MKDYLIISSCDLLLSIIQEKGAFNQNRQIGGFVGLFLGMLYNLFMKYKFKAFVLPFIYIIILQLLIFSFLVLTTTFCIAPPCHQLYTAIPLKYFVRHIPIFISLIILMITFFNIIKYFKISKLKKNNYPDQEVQEINKIIKNHKIKRGLFFLAILSFFFGVIFAGNISLRILGVETRPIFKTHYPGAELQSTECLPGMLIGYNQDGSLMYCE